MEWASPVERVRSWVRELRVVLGAGVCGGLFGLVWWRGTPRPLPGPYADGQPVETVLEVRPYLVPTASVLVLVLALICVCLCAAVLGGVIARRCRSGAWRGRLAGLALGVLIAGSLAARVGLGWLATGPEEYPPPVGESSSLIVLGWGWTDADCIVFERHGPHMVPIRTGA